MLRDYAAALTTMPCVSKNGADLNSENGIKQLGFPLITTSKSKPSHEGLSDEFTPSLC